MKLRPKSYLALDLYRAALPSGVEPVMPRLRGSPKSRRLIIAPPCGPEEYAAGVPFSGDAAKAFHEILLDHNLNTQEDFLVVTCSAYGKKPSMQSTGLIREYVMACARAKLFDLYVCVGDDAFKFLFGAGKKPASSTLYGSVLYVPETGHMPLFVYPSPQVLAPVMGNDTRENRRAADLADKFNVKFRQWTQKLATLTRISHAD